MEWNAGGKVICLLIGYLFGNFMTAEIVVRRATGRPAAELGGSGNPGMANVMAHLGFRKGITVLIGDIAKTILAGVLCLLIFGWQEGLSLYYAGTGAVIGHDFPFWNRFRGGKGVAATCTALPLYMLFPGFAADLIGAAVVFLTGYLCIGAVVIPLSFTIPAFLLGGTEAGWLTIFLTVLMFFRHFPAIRGISQGKTKKIRLAALIREKLGKSEKNESSVAYNPAFADRLLKGERGNPAGGGRIEDTTGSDRPEAEKISGGGGTEEGTAATARRQPEVIRDMEVIRRHYTFYGRVQGVGFRYQAMYAAREYSLTGWVENMPDGTVEMEVQGTADEMARMITRIRMSNFIRIDDFDVHMVPVLDDERSFKVRGY